MRFELQLLRPFRLVDRERDSEVPLRSNAKIVAYLALSRSPRSRESILQVTWPEVEAKVSRNRLRVALNQLRALLPGVLVESSAGLTLDRAVLHCDAWDLEQAIDDCANTVTEADELAQLSRTLPAMDEASPMGRWPDVSEEFRATVAAAHVRAVSVAQCLEKYEDAARLAEQGLTWDTAHPELWSGFVNASWSLGTGAAALERLRATKNMELQQLPTLRELADQVRTAPAPEVKSLSATEGP